LGKGVILVVFILGGAHGEARALAFPVVTVASFFFFFKIVTLTVGNGLGWAGPGWDEMR